MSNHGAANHRNTQGENTAPGPSLVTRCLTGDDAAKAEFVTTYAPLITRAVAARLAQFSNHLPIRGDVEDLCNEILERILRDNCRLLASLRDARRINAWLVTLSRNHVVDAVRRHSSRLRAHEAIQNCVHPPAEQRPPQPDGELMRAETAGMVHDALNRMDHEDRLVLQLYYLDNLKYAEIAEITNRNINTVAARLRRAKSKLKRMIPEDLGRSARHEPVSRPMGGEPSS